MWLTKSNAFCSKNERGELRVRDQVNSGDVIICNNASLIDYVYLELSYSPLFTTVAINAETKKHGFRKLAAWEIPFYAMGIMFPSEVAPNYIYDDLEKLRDSQYVRRPVVLFPEATKTNGRGVLDFHPDVTDIILRACQINMHVHALRFDYEFEYTSPYNTVDPLGVKSFFKLLTQVRNTLVV